MGKNQNTYAKRQREAEKRRKAQEKRTRRLKRKDESAQATKLAVVEDSATDE